MPEISMPMAILETIQCFIDAHPDISEEFEIDIGSIERIAENMPDLEAYRLVLNIDGKTYHVVCTRIGKG